MLSYRLPLGMLAFLVLFFGMRTAQAQPIDDVMVRYSRMVITKTNPDFILKETDLGAVLPRRFPSSDSPTALRKTSEDESMNGQGVRILRLVIV